MSQSTDAARENSRQRNGEFGEQSHTAPEATLGIHDLSTWAPVDVDEFIAANVEEQGRATRPLRWLESTLTQQSQALAQAEARADAEGAERYEGQLDYLRSQVAGTEDKIAEAEAALDAIRALRLPHEQEYRARGQWTRAFLATSAGGHVHSSMNCSTCNNGLAPTKFAWLTEFSGMDEADIIDAAGSDCCTVCYPDAPVESLARPRRMFSPEEKAKQADRIAREQKRSEVAAKRIANGLTPDGSELVVYTEPEGGRFRRYPERFKTERAAVIWATDHFSWQRPGYDQPERQAARDAAVLTIAEAIAVKHNLPTEYVIDELRIKGELKAQRVTKKQADAMLADAKSRHRVN